MKGKKVRVRRVLIAMAGLAVLIEAVAIGLRWRSYESRAQHESWQAGEYRTTARRFEERARQLRTEWAHAASIEEAATLLREIDEANDQADAFGQLAAWSDEKALKYQVALRRPWLIASPDRPFVRRRAGRLTGSRGPITPSAGVPVSEAGTLSVSSPVPGSQKREPNP